MIYDGDRIAKNDINTLSSEFDVVNAVFGFVWFAVKIDLGEKL